MAKLDLTLQEIEELNEKYKENFGDFPPTAEMGGGKRAYERIQKAIGENKPIKIEYPLDREY